MQTPRPVHAWGRGPHGAAAAPLTVRVVPPPLGGGQGRLEAVRLEAGGQGGLEPRARLRTPGCGLGH